MQDYIGLIATELQRLLQMTTKTSSNPFVVGIGGYVTATNILVCVCFPFVSAVSISFRNFLHFNWCKVIEQRLQNTIFKLILCVPN